MAKRDKQPRLLDAGEWNNGKTTWEFFESEQVPDPRLCSAIACIAITNLQRGEFVVTRNNRGWEMIAGGIDTIHDYRETPREAVRREALEEGGVVVANLQEAVNMGIEKYVTMN